MMSFISTQGPLSTIVHGFFHGMMIEGTCRWGIDPTWVKPEPPKPVDPTSRKDAYLLRHKHALLRKMNKPETVDKVPICDQATNLAYMPASIQYVYPADQEVFGDICVEDNGMMYGSKVVMETETRSSKQMPSELLALLTPVNK